MESRKRFLTALFLYSLGFSLSASGAGLWLKEPAGVRTWLAQTDFVPDFFLVKAATMSRAGELKVAHTHDALMEGCDPRTETQAWLTHHLSAKGTLSEAAGKRLAAELSMRFIISCFKAIELDIEPLPSPPPWLKGFLSGISSVRDTWSIRLAIPPVSVRKRPPPALSWTPEEALTVLEWTDGLDLMIYDTAPANREDYEALIHENVAFAAKAFARFPNKQLVLGLPAYTRGRGSAHPVEIENLNVVEMALKSLPPDKAKILCAPNVRLAYYPDPGEIDDKKKVVAKKIESWKQKLCKK